MLMKTSCWRRCAVHFMMGLRNCQARCVFTATIKCPVLNMFICALRITCLVLWLFLSYRICTFSHWSSENANTAQAHSVGCVFWGLLMKPKQSKYYFGDVSLSVWQISNHPSSGSIFCHPFQGEIFYRWSNQMFPCSPASCWPVFKGLCDGSYSDQSCNHLTKYSIQMWVSIQMLKLIHKAGGNCRVRQFFSVGLSLGVAAFTSKESWDGDVDLK